MVAWSHSVLDSFETCPLRHKLTKITKVVKEPQTTEMAYGNRVHKELELRIGKKTPLSEFSRYEEVAAALERKAVGGQIVAEQRMALNAQFQPVSFFDKATWVRAITDVSIYKGSKAFVGDYKTGNPKPNSPQLRLTAAVTFATYPYIEEIHNAFIWLKTGTLTKEVFHKADAPSIWQEFMPKVQRLEIAIAEDKFPPKPSGLCKNYCPVPHSLCQYRGG